MTVIHFYSRENFSATIDLKVLPTLPLVKIRKLLKLMLSEPNRNTEAIMATEAWLTEEVSKAKNDWMEAREKYQENFRTTDLYGFLIPEAQQKKINQPLISSVKKARSNFERTQKIRFSFQKIQNKERKNYA